VKELLAVLKEPRSRYSIFIPPILQCLIYGYVATYDLTDVPYAVYDRDRSQASHNLLAQIDGSGVFRRVANLENMRDVRSYIDRREALLIVLIDTDFERRLMLGQNVDIQVIADGRNSNTAGIALGYVSTSVETFNHNWRVKQGQPSVPMRTVVRAWYNPNLETRWSMVPSLLGTFTMMQTLLLCAMSIAREREQGTFDQLLVTPFRPAEIIVGKAIPAVLIGIIQGASVLLIAQLWFRIPFAGSYVVLFVALTIYLLAAVGMGLFVSSLAATMQQAMLYSFVVMMPFILLSGLTTPIRSMPEPIQYLTLINPLRYAIDIARRVYLEGAGFMVLMPDILPLIAIAVVSLSVSSWMFRHRIE
jgi:ABC-2 type transport system permease protein